METGNHLAENSSFLRLVKALQRNSLKPRAIRPGTAGSSRERNG
jgi:hypothetical protein